MRKIIFIFVVMFTVLSTNAQELFNFGASYKADVGRNFDGGIKQGNVYMGLISLNGTVNTKIGTFYADIQNTHGSMLSGEYVGDFQYVSNIENGFGYSNYTFLHQLWYKLDINKSSLLVGIHDLNSELLVSDNAGYFINASFGIMPTASGNVPTSIFPITTLGAVFTQQTENVDVKVAIYNGYPYNDNEYFGFNKFKFDDKFFTLGEVKFNVINTKLGAYYHYKDTYDVRDTSMVYNGNYGIYGITDQVLYKITDERNVSSFLKLGFSPDDRNVVTTFVGGGLVFNGTFLKRDNDKVGLAFTYNGFNNFYNDYENAFECFYQFNLNDNIMIQPEFQYVMSPNLNSELGNAFVGLVRFVIQTN